MRVLRSALIAFIGSATPLFLHSAAFAQERGDLQFSWMLPKTVIDTTILYTFESCGPDAKNPANGDKLKVKITATLAARAIPDKIAGVLAMDTAKLKSFWQDRNVSLQTFSGSHILQAIGSAPTDQTSTIIGNILGGIVKVVGIGLGVASPAANVPKANCAIGDGSAQESVKQIKTYKDDIETLEKQLGMGVAEEATQKKLAAQIQAKQTLMADLQAKLTITVKQSIDPGFSPLDINKDSEQPLQYLQNEVPILKNGLVATFAPSDTQLKNAKPKWFADPTNQHGNPLLQVNVYLDFAKGFVNGSPPPIKASADGTYAHTKVFMGDIYRDVAYVPVLVWRGDKDNPSTPPDDDGTPTGPVQLAQPQTMAFGQYGVVQNPPFDVSVFKSLTWSVTFTELGEITSASFASKSPGVSATSLFGSVASAANSIAAEKRSAATAADPESQAAVLQGQSDLVYQTQRLALCQASAKNCPSK